jgi:hypothetical protein
MEVDGAFEEGTDIRMQERLQGLEGIIVQSLSIYDMPCISATAQK